MTTEYIVRREGVENFYIKKKKSDKKWIKFFQRVEVDYSTAGQAAVNLCKGFGHL